MIRYRGPSHRLRLPDGFALRDGLPVLVTATTLSELRRDPSMVIEIIRPKRVRAETPTTTKTSRPKRASSPTTTKEDTP